MRSDPNAICDRCGFKYKRSQLRLEYTNLMVCHGPNTNKCWEPRHPQDFVRGVPDRQSIPGARPALAPVFLAINQVTADDL